MSMVANVSFSQGKKHIFDALHAEVNRTGEKVSAIVVDALEARYVPGDSTQKKILASLARIEHQLQQGTAIAATTKIKVAEDQAALQGAALEAIGL